MNARVVAVDRRRALFRLIVACCVAWLSACSVRPPVVERDGVPAGTRNPEAIPDAVPRLEIPGKAGNRSPYTVLGRTYHVLPTAQGYVERGVASWYGSKFHGRKTSNGEVFDAWGMTAAHRSLPIPVYARVTNLDNGRSTVVRINDRGPFHAGRIIDLSYAAALKLGFASKGTAPVEVRVIESDPPRIADAPGADGDGNVPSPPQATASASPGPAAAPVAATDAQAAPGADPVQVANAPSFYLQVGAFRSFDTAQRVMAQLETLTGMRVMVDTGGSAESVLHKVRVGPLSGVGEANRVRALIAEARLGEPLLVRLP